MTLNKYIIIETNDKTLPVEQWDVIYELSTPLEASLYMQLTNWHLGVEESTNYYNHLFNGYTRRILKKEFEKQKESVWVLSVKLDVYSDIIYKPFKFFTEKDLAIAWLNKRKYSNTDSKNFFIRKEYHEPNYLTFSSSIVLLEQRQLVNSFKEI